jgi:hypothetical protein
MQFRHGGNRLDLIACLLLLIAAPVVSAQTASTGALSGTILDPAAAVVPNAEIKVTNQATSEIRVTRSRADGTFVTPLLPAGEYRVAVTAGGFAPTTLTGVRVTVTETTRLNVELTLETLSGAVEVTATPELTQLETSALGRVANERTVTELPLVSRNYTQIIGLSPGITTDVTNASELGRGSGGLSANTATGGTFVHGQRSYDNNFQMNGLQINDVFAQGATSGGVAIPNPDTILEFKVQTGLYDAAFGRNAGANVNLVTRSGANEFHGSLFEFFRNTDLNANNFFTNRAGRPRPVLNQNQFGGTFGGPAIKNRLLFFGSYQGTRQVNGVSSISTILSPALTDDRSAAALGSLFVGQRGAQQNAFGGLGPAIAADGSNINPVALKLFQLKLADGSYLIPTPQTINPAAPFASRGTSTFSRPSRFSENQYMANGDYLINSGQKLSARFFNALSDQTVQFPAANVPGFPNMSGNLFLTSSLSHSWTITPRLFNELRAGYNRNRTTTTQQTPFTFSSIGSSAPPQSDDLPILVIPGSLGLNTAPVGQRVQNMILMEDSLSWIAGKHTVRGGGGMTRVRRNFTGFRQPAQLQFPTYPDLLLGLNAQDNGTAAGPAPFSNIIASVDLTGQFDRAARTWEASGYFQDDFRATSRLTLNLGLRWEFAPPFSDALGRASDVYIGLLNPNPPTAGTLAGIVVASNFAGTVPSGVTQAANQSTLFGTDANMWAPRFGFAWQALPNSNRLVVRGGYGIYYSRYTGQAQSQTTTTQPYGQLRVVSGPANAAANLARPFRAPLPAPATYPAFFPYTPSTVASQNAVDPTLRPGMVQQFSLNLQYDLGRNFLLEAGYVGARGTRLLRVRSVNQAQLASVASPIRGATTNTVGNVQTRARFRGWSVPSLQQVESAGSSWYNGAEMSLTKRFSSGLQLLASYTFSKSLDSDGANVVQNSNISSAIGEQNDWRQRYGPASFSRPHRFILSYVYELPWLKGSKGLTQAALGGWNVSGVMTIQTGQPLTILATNTNNVYGINATGGDRAQLALGCTHPQLSKPGSVTSRIGGYFNNACFTRALVVGNDNVATTFGNSGVGIVRGPAQNNFDISLGKTFGLWSEKARLQFRTEFFNAFNTPQFSNPNTNFSNATFGQITATSVSPRIIQFALKLNF